MMTIHGRQQTADGNHDLAGEPSVQDLADDMRALYDYIYKDEPWDDKLKSQEQFHMDRRHIVRWMVHKKHGATLRAVCEAEALLTGDVKPNHATIWNSLRQVEDVLKEDLSVFIAELNHFYAQLSRKPKGTYIERIAAFQREDDHVKSILLASLVEFGFVADSQVQAMLGEYRQIAPEFLDGVMNSNES